MTGAPPLAGQSQAYLARQLAAYATGGRQHPVMTPIAKGLNPREREALAAYYSGLVAPLPPPQLGRREADRQPGVTKVTFPSGVTKITSFQTLRNPT